MHASTGGKPADWIREASFPRVGRDSAAFCLIVHRRGQR